MPSNGSSSAAAVWAVLRKECRSEWRTRYGLNAALLFALASLRAHAFPAAISVVILLGGVVGFYALVPPFAVPLGLAIAWLGVWMLRTAPAHVIAEPALH